MPLNVVLSYGDLSRQTGYRTRVIGELSHLDLKNAAETTLLVFDRDPRSFENEFRIDSSYRVHPRASVHRFYQDMRDLARRQPIGHIHAHNLYSAALALSARPLYGYKVILDYHGRIPEEYVFQGKGGGTSRKLLESLEQWAVRRSDHVVVVSEKLRSYLLERYEEAPSKVSVIPCCADGDSFNWNVDRRETTRRKLGLADRIVCTHLGSFFEWYEPELLVQLFQQLAAQRSNAHLLVVTPTVEETSSYLASRLRTGSFTVMFASHSQVPSILNASDLGFLLLRSSPNIKTSSPAKFSEYLNSGLPVVITPDVGDFSNLVERAGLGLVASDSHLDVATIDQIMGSRETYARSCTEAGRDLTWQAYEKQWHATAESLKK